MKIMLFTLTVFLLLNAVVLSSFADVNESPLKQSKTVSDIHDIKCKPHLTLIFKAHEWIPACVKPSSVNKLIERGWAADHDPRHMMK